MVSLIFRNFSNSSHGGLVDRDYRLLTGDWVKEFIELGTWYRKFYKSVWARVLGEIPDENTIMATKTVSILSQILTFLCVAPSPSSSFPASLCSALFVLLAFSHCACLVFPWAKTLHFTLFPRTKGEEELGANGVSDGRVVLFPLPSLQRNSRGPYLMDLICISK